MSFNQVLKQGLIISFISKYSVMIVQLIVGMVLARLLTPAEFGVFAIVLVFVAFFTLMSDIGIAPAVIQSKEVDNNDIFNYFVVSIGLGIVLSLLFFGLSFGLVRFYSNEVYLKLGVYLTIAIFFTSISILPSAVLSKQKKFKELGILRLAAALLSGIIAVLLAFNNFSYYSLVAQSIVYAAVLFFGSFIYSKFHLYFNQQKSTWKDVKISIAKIAKYSSYNFAYNFINYFSRNLDSILIGKYLGATSLGYYDKAFRLMLFPVSSLNQVFSPILHPMLADYQENKEFIFDVFSKMMRLLALVGISATVFLFFNASDIILIMYGEQWVKSIPVFQILSLTVWIQLLVATCGAFFLAANKANLYFYDGIAYAVIIISAIVLGVLQSDLVLLSYYLVVAYYVASLVTFYFVMILIFNKSFLDLFVLFIKPAIVALFVFVAVQLNGLLAIDTMLLRLLMSSVIAFIGFMVGLVVTREHQFIKRIITNK